MTEIFRMHYIGESDGKKEKRRQKILTYYCSYTQSTWSLSMFIQHLKKIAQMGAGKSLTKFCQRKRKMDK